MPCLESWLEQKIIKDIEGVQKRCLRLLYPSFSYTEVLSKSGLDRLDYRRDMITQNVFRQSNTLTALLVNSC